MAGIRLHPKLFARQWASLPSKFEANVFNFETLAGEAAVNVFRGSFYLHRFNSSGQAAWPSRKDNNPWPLLVETGSLRDSIIVRKRSPKHHVYIYTDDACTNSSTDGRKYGGRDSKTKQSNFVYAAIHNMGGMAAGATGNAALIRKRQFMGPSTVLDDKLEKLAFIHIFDGFPK